jgi:hypothetical protein
MTSEEQISDEIYAQQLQDEEIRASRGRHTQQSVTGTQPPVLLQAGQAVLVRLHHVLTSRQIGEVLIAHYISNNIMMFEMSNRRGHHMRIKGHGAVEFSPRNDNKCHMVVEMIPSGGMFLKPMMYMQDRNETMGIGCYLSMSQEGALSGMGGRTQNAQWMLVAAHAAPQQQQQSTVGVFAPTTAAVAPTAAGTGISLNNLFRRTPSSSTVVNQSDVFDEASNPLMGGLGDDTPSSQPRDSSTDGVELQSVVSGGDAASSASNNDVYMGSSAQSYAHNNLPVLSRTNAVNAAAGPAPLPPAPIMAAPIMSGTYPPAPSTIIANAGPGPMREIMRSISQTQTQTVKFPGYDANKDALMQFFQTVEGQYFLSNTPQLVVAQQLMAYGVLKNILHR